MTDAASHLAAVRRHYPDAHTTVESVERHLNLFQRRLGLRPADVLLADSICADDVNSIEYPKRAYEMPGPFKLGGLDGFPFVGLTGMAAFAGHVPDPSTTVSLQPCLARIAFPQRDLFALGFPCCRSGAVPFPSQRTPARS